MTPDELKKIKTMENSIGRSNQDQEMAEIREMWDHFDLESKQAVLKLLESDSLQVKHQNDEIVMFYRKCCLVGLRQSIFWRVELHG